MSKYKGMFLSETREHLQSMGRLAVSLEQTPDDQEGINAMFRAAHSIKGMAASMGYQRTAELSHSLEDLMDVFRKSGAISSEAIDRLLAGVDLLEKLLQDIEADREERDVAPFLTPGAVAPDAPADPPASPGSAPPRIGSALQVVVELAPEAAAPAARAFLVLKELAGCGEVLHSVPSQQELLQGGGVRRLELWLKTEMSPAELEPLLLAMADVTKVSFGGDRRQRSGAAEQSGRSIRVQTSLLDHLIDLTGELITHRYQLQTSFDEERWKDLGEGMEQLARHLRDLHYQVLKVRMMPLESITGQLPRLVRDLAHKGGKEVLLQILGEKVELDRAILEVLADPLIHLVRNAVDHGIVMRGEVTIRAWREKDQVSIEVADNGRGIDPEQIRQKALAQGLVSQAQVQGMGDEEILQLVCCPGFSTAGTVTETSGRGVGMDIVKSTVEELGGSLEIFSAKGQGSRFLLKLPLSAAIMQVLLLGVDERLVGIPINRVLQTLVIDRNELVTRGRQVVVRLKKRNPDQPEDEAEIEEIPLLSLRKILALRAQPMTGQLPLVLVEARGRKVGLVIDRLAGKREVFVKALAPPLNRIPGLSGGAVLGDGRVIFILEPQALLESIPARRMDRAG